MSLQLDGMERALTEFVAKYLPRFTAIFWTWHNMNECEATLYVKPQDGSDSTWKIPVAGDDHGGFGGVLTIKGEIPLFIDTLFEYVWDTARRTGGQAE